MATQSGRLVTVNTRISRESLPITGFLPKTRLLDLQHVTLQPAAGGSGGEAALRVVGVMTSVNGSGYPAATLVTDAGDVTFTGSSVTADWAAICAHLSIEPFSPAPPVLSGTFARGHPVSAAAAEAYQAAVAQCEYRTSGAGVVPQGGFGSPAHAQACSEQREYERSRTAELRTQLDASRGVV